MINYGRFYNLPEAPPRIVKINGQTLGIATYDIDNGYPQRINSLINASPTAKACVDLFVRFLIGNGCKDATFYKAKINATGLTPDKLLKRIAQDLGRFKGFAVHVNYNALYQVESVSYVPWKNCRLGLEPDYNGRIAISPEWYNNIRYGQWVRRANIDYIWKFNSDPIEIERQVEYAGGWDKYQGQIYWYSPEVDDYPLSPFDSVIDPMITEFDSNITTKNNIKSNFQARTVWITKGKLETAAEEEDRRNDIKSFMGPNGNNVAVFESLDASGADVPELKSIENNLDDALFKYSDDKTRNQIYRALNQNPVLHADLQGRYNQNQLPESQEYYNSLITPDKLVIEEFFQEVFSIFHTDINPTKDYTLIPLPVTKITSPVTVTNGNSTTDNADGL